MSEQKVRVGIVGYGRVAEGHLKRLRQHEDCFDVIGVCDRTDSRREAASEAGVPFVTEELGDLLGQGPELVLVTTHSSAHHEIAMRCLEEPVHLLIEKPMTPTAAETEEIVNKAREKGVVATAFHNRRFDGDYRKVKKLVEERGVGELIRVENRAGGPRPAMGFGVQDFEQAWRITKAMGGGTLLDFGPHWIDQTLDLVPGTVKGVFADVRNVKWGDADDFFHVTMLFDNGAHAVASKADFVYHVPPKWLIYGSEATIYSDPEGAIHWKQEEDEATEEEGVPGGDITRNMYDVVRHGAEPVIKPEEALRVARIIDAARKSAEQRAVVPVHV